MSLWKRKRSVPGRRRGGLHLEVLEDRTLLSVNVVTSFVGLNTHDAGDQVEPPDPIAAAGPTAIVEMVNSNIAYYDKVSGAALFSQDLGTFFASVDPTPTLFSDVNVTYDEQAGRFFVSTMDIAIDLDPANDASYFDFAISNDSNPLHGFQFYQINTTETSARTGEPLFTDFPRLGWNADAYVVTFNMFGFLSNFVGGSPVQYNVQILTIDKAKLLDPVHPTLSYHKGDLTTNTTAWDRPVPNSTMVPAVMHGSAPGDPMWFVEEKGLEQDGSYQDLRVVKMTGVLSATPTFTDYYVPMNAYGTTPFPQDTANTVSYELDTRILNVDWRKNQMVLAQNVGIGSNINTHARWYEMSTAGAAPSMVQQGEINPGPGIDTYMPSVALAADGTIGMTYMESAAGVEDMSMYVTGRSPSDPSGTMQPGVKVSPDPLPNQFYNYDGSRIGDFSGITVDPSDPSTFWAVNEYAIQADPSGLIPNWGTYIGQFNVDTAPAFPTPLPGGNTVPSTPKPDEPGIPPKNHDSPPSRDGLLLQLPPLGPGRPNIGGITGSGTGSGPGSGPSPRISTGSSFKGLNTHDAGDQVEPPDPIAAAGPTAIVEMVNSNIAYYDKVSGAALFSQDLGTFFASVDPTPTLFSDVNVTYDEQAGRFFVSTMDIAIDLDPANDASYFDFAISNDSNPLHGFQFYQINTTETSARTGEPLFTDFPRLGWNADAYVVTFNMFGFLSNFVGGSPVQYNVQILTIDKAKLLDPVHPTLSYHKGDLTTNTTAWDRPVPNSTMVPAVMHGSAPGDPMWFVEEKGLEQDGSYQDLRVVKMTGVLSATPTFTDYYVPMNAYGTTPFPQDTANTVSYELDTRILNVDWRKNQMVLAQNVGIGSNINTHARWYEMSTAGAAPSMVQQGEINPGPGIDTYMPSVALAADGTIGMTYMESAAGVEDMSMYVTGRSPSDPSGTMQPGVKVSPDPLPNQFYNYDGSRIGDFSGITVDPSDPSTFWAVNEYAIQADPSGLIPNWGTWIANFEVAPQSVRRTWTGRSTTSSNWSDPANWAGGVAPVPGDNLIFGPGASQLSNTDNFGSGSIFGSITFSSAGYTISGNAITLSGNLDGTAATGNNTFNLNVTLANGAGVRTGPTNTDLTLGGTINDGGATFTVNGGVGRVDFTGAITGSGGLTVNDTGGTVALSGPAETYTGTTTVQAGTLLLNNSSGNAVPGTLTVSGGTVRLLASNQIADTAAVTINTSGLLDLNNNSDAVGSVTLSTGTVTTGTGTLTLGGNVTDTGASSISGNLALGAAVRTFTVNASSTLTVSAAVGGSVGLTKAGNGTLVLSVANGYKGGSTLSAGTLTVGNNSALGTGSLTLANGTTLSVTGTAVTLANALTLNGIVTFAGTVGLTLNAPIVLTANRTLMVSNTAGVTLQGGVTESGGARLLTKAGSGTLILPVADSYSGGTTLSSGTLVLGNNTALGTGRLTITTGTLSATGSAVTLANTVILGGNLSVSGSLAVTFTGPVTLTGNRTLTLTNTAPTTISGVVGQSGGTWKLTKAGSGVLVLQAANTYAGGTLLGAGTLTVGNNSALGSGSLTLANGTTLSPGTAVTLANALTLNGNVTFAGTVGLTLSAPIVLTANRTLTVSNTAGVTLQGGVTESGGARLLTKAGSGKLILPVADSYSGGTTLSSGTLVLGNNTALGTGRLTITTGTLSATGSVITLANTVTLGGNLSVSGSLAVTFAGPVTLTGNRTLTLTNTAPTTISGVVGQSGGTWQLTKAGSGVLVLQAANTYAGGTVLSAGTLTVGNNSALGSGALTITSGTITAGGGPITLANALTMGGNFTVAGNQALRFTGAATLTGARTITVTNTSSTTLAGNIGQSASGLGLTKAGTGTLILSGTNSYTGTTTITAGTLLVNGSQTLSAVSVESGATLSGTGSVGTVTAVSGGHVAPGAGTGLPGMLTAAAVTLPSGSTFNVALNGTTAGSGYAQLRASGTINITGSTLNVSLGFTPAIGNSFTIINNTGAGTIVGTFNGLTQNGTFTQNGMVFQISYTGGNGNDVVLKRIS